MDALASRHTGTFERYNRRRGYGFIRDDNGDSVFIHAAAPGVRQGSFIQPGTRLSYYVERDERGPRAVAVQTTTWRPASICDAPLASGTRDAIICAEGLVTERARVQILRRSMWVKPSGYVIGALLAGALSAAGPQRFSAAALPLVALWVVLDLCAGTLARSIHVLGRSGSGRAGRRRPWHQALQALMCVLSATALAMLLPTTARLLAGLTLALCVLEAFATRAQAVIPATALVEGTQVVGAWATAYVLVTGLVHPVAALGVLAGAGTYGRLSHAFAQKKWSLWVTRLSWIGMFAVLVVSRQPLLAGVVALTGCADDLYRTQPLRKGDAGPLAAASWVGGWVLIAIASTYWSLAT